MEHKGEYLYYNGTFNSTSSTPDENQGWVFHTVGDKIKLQSTYSYDPEYLSFSDRDQETINMGTNATGSEFNMLSAVTSTYVASPLCNQEIEIIFETGNGDFVDNAPATNPLTVTMGETITLPTCEYPGYEFMGWMKDEQQLDPSDIIGTYYTGDYTVDGVSSTITFYAYYKVIPEEVEFTGKDDVELLMYYYDGTKNYYYAVSHAAERGELSSKQNCFNATLQEQRQRNLQRLWQRALSVLRLQRRQCLAPMQTGDAYFVQSDIAEPTLTLIRLTFRLFRIRVKFLYVRMAQESIFRKKRQRRFFSKRKSQFR